MTQSQRGLVLRRASAVVREVPDPDDGESRSLTAERLRSLLDYNPETGEFTWLVNRRGRFARIGTRAGGDDGRGYRVIGVDCVIYQAARLAVLWMTGQWPERVVDHRNLNKGDDRWENLRPATYSQNGANAGARGHHPKGVTLAKGKFLARIKVDYRTINLGQFNDAESAHAAYCAAAAEHFGEFARRS